MKLIFNFTGLVGNSLGEDLVGSGYLALPQAYYNDHYIVGNIASMKQIVRMEWYYATYRP